MRKLFGWMVGVAVLLGASLAMQFLGQAVGSSSSYEAVSAEGDVVNAVTFFGINSLILSFCLSVIAGSWAGAGSITKSFRKDDLACFVTGASTGLVLAMVAVGIELLLTEGRSEVFALVVSLVEAALLLSLNYAGYRWWKQKLCVFYQ